MSKLAASPLDGDTGSVVEIGDGRELLDASPLQTVLSCRDRGEAAALVTIIGASVSIMAELLAVRYGRGGGSSTAEPPP